MTGSELQPELTEAIGARLRPLGIRRRRTNWFRTGEALYTIVNVQRYRSGEGSCTVPGSGRNRARVRVLGGRAEPVSEGDARDGDCGEREGEQRDQAVEPPATWASPHRRRRRLDRPPHRRQR